MCENDTIFDTESGADAEIREPVEVGEYVQAEMPICSEDHVKGAGGGAAEKPASSISTGSGDTKFSYKGDLIYESRVAKALGLSQMDLAAFREAKLKEGDDWTRYHGAVVYTDMGFEKIKRWYEKFPGAGAGNVEIESDKEYAFLKVYRTTKNPKLLLAVGVDVEIRNRKKLPVPEIIQRIKVGPSKVWCPGMIIRCLRVIGNRWIYRGKLPQVNTKHRFFAKPTVNPRKTHS